MFIIKFAQTFGNYFIELVPPLIIGLIISGIVHELIPETWVQENLGKKGIKGIFFASLIGTILPVCCWGSLPIAISFHKKGASLGPIFAFLVATPATSINALFVAWKFMGTAFTVYIFFAVLIMGIIMGVIGNFLTVKKGQDIKECDSKKEPCKCVKQEKKTKIQFKIYNILKYAFIDMPKEIGLETLAGIAMASLVSAIGFVGSFIKAYLTRGYGYLFALFFGLLVYMCSTMSVPLVHAFVKKGLNPGAGMGLLILGPIASIGTILVLRKEFGFKILSVFLISVSSLSLLAGCIFSRFFL